MELLGDILFWFFAFYAHFCLVPVAFLMPCCCAAAPNVPCEFCELAACDTLTTVQGTIVSGLRTNTHDEDDVELVLAPAAGGFEFIFDFDLTNSQSVEGTPEQVKIWSDTANTLNPTVQAYNYDTTTWDTIGTYNQSADPQLFTLTSDHADASSTVRIKLVSASTNTALRVYVDVILVRKRPEKPTSYTITFGTWSGVCAECATQVSGQTFALTHSPLGNCNWEYQFSPTLCNWVRMDLFPQPSTINQCANRNANDPNRGAFRLVGSDDASCASHDWEISNGVNLSGTGARNCWVTSYNMNIYADAGSSCSYSSGNNVLNAVA